MSSRASVGVSRCRWMVFVSSQIQDADPLQSRPVGAFTAVRAVRRAEEVGE